MSHATHRSMASAPRRVIASTLAVLHFLWRWAGWLVRNPGAWKCVLLRTMIICRQGGCASLWRAVFYKALHWQAETSAEAWLVRYRKFVAKRDRARTPWPADAPHLRIVVSLARFDGPGFERFVRSLAAQSYRAWDLQCHDDRVADTGVRRLALNYAAYDSRVRVCTMSQGVEMLRAAEPDVSERDLYFVLADRVVEFEVAALAYLAEAVMVAHADLVYGDHIEQGSGAQGIAEIGALPAFSYEFMLATGYLSGCAVVRGSLIRELDKGATRAALEGDSFELLLQVVEQTRRVTHVPAIIASMCTRRIDLRHRSAAVARHLERTGASAEVVIDHANSVLDVRATLETTDEAPRVAIVIPTRNAHELLRQCVDSLVETGALAHADLWIVDHRTDEPAALEYLEELSRDHHVVRASGPFNFSRLVNHGVATAGEGYSHYLLLNNDIEALSRGWLVHLLSVAMRPGVGAVGATLLYPDRIIQHAGVVVGMRGLAGHFLAGMSFFDEQSRRRVGPQKMLVSTREVSAVTAACVLVSREAWTAAGGFEESIAVGYGDVDFCLRLGELGYRVLQDAHAVLVHHESRTRGRAIWDPHPADTRQFLSRYHTTILGGDPCSSPLLSNVLTQGQLGRARPGACRTSVVAGSCPVWRTSGLSEVAASRTRPATGLAA